MWNFKPQKNQTENELGCTLYVLWIFPLHQRKSVLYWIWCLCLSPCTAPGKGCPKFKKYQPSFTPQLELRMWGVGRLPLHALLQYQPGVQRNFLKSTWGRLQRKQKFLFRHEKFKPHLKRKKGLEVQSDTEWPDVIMTSVQVACEAWATQDLDYLSDPVPHSCRKAQVDTRIYTIYNIFIPSPWKALHVTNRTLNWVWIRIGSQTGKDQHNGFKMSGMS